MRQGGSLLLEDVGKTTPRFDCPLTNDFDGFDGVTDVNDLLQDANVCTFWLGNQGDKSIISSALEFTSTGDTAVGDEETADETSGLLDCEDA